MLETVASGLYPKLEFITELVKLASNGDRPLVASIAGFVVISLLVIILLRKRSFFIYASVLLVFMAGCVVLIAEGVAYAAIWADAFKHMSAAVTAVASHNAADGSSLPGGTTGSTPPPRKMLEPKLHMHSPPVDGNTDGKRVAVIYAPDAEHWSGVRETSSTITLEEAPAD